MLHRGMPRFDHYAQGTPCCVELLTPDPEGAQAFYGPLLGWSFDDLAPDLAVARKDGAAVAWIRTTEHPRARWSVHLAVDDVDDVDEVVAQVAGAGGWVDTTPSDVLDLGRSATITDPTGAQVGLWQAGSSIGVEVANEPGTLMWNELVSPDLARGCSFYAAVLGVAWGEMPMGDGSAYTCLVVEGRPVGGAVRPVPAGAPPHWNVHVNATDVDATTARAVALGAVVTVPAHDVPGTGRLAALTDPQGALLWLMGLR